MTGDYDEYFAARQCWLDDQQARCHLPEYLLSVLPSDRHIRILDIGCGQGAILRSLRRKGYSALRGIDISQQAVDFCRHVGLQVEQVSNLGEYAKTISDRFDFIILTHVIEHFRKADVIPFLKTIKADLLSENGKLLIATPNAQSPVGAYWAYEDFTHEVLFTTGSLYFVLHRAGFRSITVLDHYGLMGRSRFKRPLLHLRARVAHWLYRQWLAATGSAIHASSPVVLTWELKVVAT